MNKKIDNIWALIVCYNPNLDVLLKLVYSISNQVALVRILNNGGLSAEEKTNLQLIGNVIVDDFYSNIGIGSALNYGFAIAEQSNVKFIVTFDQDSLPPAKHVETLVSHWKRLSKLKDNKKTGAIGPSFFDARGEVFHYPFFRANGLRIERLFREEGQSIVKVDFLITSGMLVPVSMWKSGLKFKDEYFIDYVDIEWCSRSGANGYQHYGCFDVSMQHQLSDENCRHFFGLIILKYSPLRRYYFFRNSVFFIQCNYVPLALRLRVFFSLFFRLLTIPFVDDNPGKSLKNAVTGLFHAFYSGKSGKLVE